MISVIRKIYHLLDQRERLQATGIFFLTLVMAFLELVGIASILPFIAVLSAPEQIKNNKWLKFVYDTLGFDSERKFLFFLGLCVLGFLIVTNVAKAVTRWVISRFSQMRAHSLSMRLLKQYLYQPYAFYLQRNTSTLRKNLGEIQSLVTNIVIPVMDLISRICVAAAILLLLVIIDPLLALSSAAVLGGAYAIVYFSMRTWLFDLGQARLEAMNRKNKLISEAFLGIKNVKLTGMEKVYVSLYHAPSMIAARANSLNSMASELPRYALEIIAFGGILFIVLYELLQSADIKQALPMITLYALAGYRLLPNFQSAFSSLAKIRFNTAMLDHAFEELHTTNAVETITSDVIEPLGFSSSIELKNIGFAYEETDKNVFSDLSFSIPVNSSIGIVGKTGSGKTTLVDIILGLLAPSQGEVLVDGVALNDQTRRAWQANTAYVSQHIFLIDDTIRNNIAFGLKTDLIDETQVIKAAQMASIHDFILGLPFGYDTVIGENGIRLSGGQRQRIGLARALYLNRPVLVLDEATSALDHETEKEVMEAIDNLGGKKTIIMIAHRLQSLSKADKIISVEAGQATI